MDTVGKAASIGKEASIGQAASLQAGVIQPGVIQPGVIQPGLTQPGLIQPGMIEATARRALPLDVPREVRGPASAEGHACAVPGYLQLPGLAMLWQCSDCGGAWRLVADEWLPGSPPLEFTWVRDHTIRREVRRVA